MDHSSRSADESIRQSLHMLNLDYPAVDSPAKDAAPTASRIVTDFSSGPPVFDRTPLHYRADAGAGDPESGERTAGPVFDNNPMQPDNTDSAIESTPVYQDTQSQSVDGTEEVTQEHNVQEQLTKYEKEHGARVAKHEENLKAYYRKYPSKLKISEGTASVPAAAPAEEPSKSPPWQVKERNDVRKRKATPGTPLVSPSVATPRRSPRIQQSKSPDKTKLTKRSCAADKIHAPEAVDEALLDDDGDDFQIADKILKGKKRQRVGAPDNNKLVETKKTRTMKKPQGRKKKTDVDEDTEKKRFQQTVRCSLGEVRAAAKLLKDAHRAKVCDAGFGCVFGWVLEGNITRVLMCHLLKIIDTSTMKIECGSEKVLYVNREAVHQAFGFPMGGDTAPRPADSRHDDSFGIRKKELGFDSNASIDTKHLRKLLATLVEDPEKVDLVVKVFFAILFNKLICPSSALRIGRKAAMLVNMDYQKMAKMDFCHLVVDELKRAAIKYQDESIPQAGPEGCGVMPTVMYLDSCYSPRYCTMNTDTPHANFLREKQLRDIYLLDIVKHGGCELSDYKFGKLGWKGRNQIAYSYRMPVEELVMDPCLRSPPRSSGLGSNPEPTAVGQHELIVTQPQAANTKSNPQPASNSGGSAPVSVIDEITNLLQKVEDLAYTIPTTADRMSRI